MAKPIKINGREASVIRSIGYGLGVSGKDLIEQTQLSKEDLCDILNTLLEAGYVETPSMKEKTDIDSVEQEMFEVNGSFASELKAAMKR